MTTQEKIIKNKLGVLGLAQHKAFQQLVKNRIHMTPSVKSEKIFIKIFLQTFCS